MIVYRLFIVIGVDCIYVLKGGEICEVGSYFELIK